MITRELVTKLGFTIDQKKLDAYERNIEGTTKKLKNLY